VQWQGCTGFLTVWKGAQIQKRLTTTGLEDWPIRLRVWTALWRNWRGAMELARQLTTAGFRRFQSTNISYPGSKGVKTRNRPMNFGMLPKYHISKIPPTGYTVYRLYLLIKPTALIFCTECLKTQVATSSLINANSLYCFLWCTALWLHQVVHNIQATHQSSQ